MFRDELYIDFSDDGKLESCVFEIYKRCRKPEVNRTHNRYFKAGKYEGELNVKGQNHGYGVMKYQGRGRYEGDFSNGLRDGLGKYTFSNGWEYIGEFRDDKKHGRGRFVTANDSYYVGEFVKGRREGKGTLILAAEKVEYVGVFKEGKFHGQGKYTNRHGDVFNGHFVLHKFQGHGKMKYANGEEFDGNWEKGKKSHGWITYANGDSYIGDWKHDMKDGEGKLFFANGDRYEGAFRRDKMHGCGKTKFSKGDCYEGPFLEGKRSGQGTYTFSTNAKYVGYWKENERHGKGEMHYANGDTFEGIYCEGERKEGRVYFKDSKVEYNGSIQNFYIDENGRKKQAKLLTKGILNFENALGSDGWFSAPNFLRKPTIYGVECNLNDKGTPRFVSLKGLRKLMEENKDIHKEKKDVEKNKPLKGLRKDMEKNKPTVNQPFLSQPIQSRVSNTTKFSSSDSISAQSMPSADYLCEGESIGNEILPQTWSSPAAVTVSPNRPWYKLPSSPKGVSTLFDTSNDSGRPPEEISLPLSPPPLTRFITA